MSDRREQIEAELAAITPGQWAVGVESDNGEAGAYWEPNLVYAVTELPESGLLPDFAWASPDDYEDSDEESYRRVSQWADEHKVGTIAETGNYFPIPDEQHEANARFIAHAPANLRFMLEALELTFFRFRELAEHHRQAELIGTKLAELVKAIPSGGASFLALKMAAEEWDAHQWPEYTAGAVEDGGVPSSVENAEQ